VAGGAAIAPVPGHLDALDEDMLGIVCQNLWINVVRLPLA
jgi:hypothetical protein